MSCMHIRFNDRDPSACAGEPWEDQAFPYYYNRACEYVREVLSASGPFRNWAAVQKRANELGSRAARHRPVARAVEASQCIYKEEGRGAKAA